MKSKLGTLSALAWLLLAGSGNTSAWMGYCHNAPGLLFPVVDWRAAYGGSLPQTHTFAIHEDTIDLTIEDGASQNLQSNQMLIRLRLPSASINRKQIAAWNSGFVATITAEPGNIGPASMLITRAPHCNDFANARTIVFRKVDWAGNMRNMYYMDFDHFWDNLGGKILNFTWQSDWHHHSYPPRYLAPLEIPAARNLGAVSRTDDRLDLYETRNGSLVHSWRTAMLFGGPVWTQQNLGPISQGYWGGGYYNIFTGRWVNGIFWNQDPEPMTSAATVSTDGTYINLFTRNAHYGINHMWSDASQNQWSQWENLGTFNLGNFVATSSPASVSWDNSGRVDVVARGQDFAVWHMAWDGSQWTPWTSLGGVFSSGPSIVSRGPGRLDVFGRGTDGAVWMNSWTGTYWTGWHSLGGVITSDPVAVVYGTERIAVFARGTDNALWVTVDNGIGWFSGWGWLDGIITSAPAAIGHSNHIEVFARGDNGELFQKTWIGPLGWRGAGGASAYAGSSGWSGWTAVPLPACNGNGC
jgi:hypothetical protein